MPDLRQGCAVAKSTEEIMPADALVLFGAMGRRTRRKRDRPPTTGGARFRATARSQVRQATVGGWAGPTIAPITWRVPRPSYAWAVFLAVCAVGTGGPFKPGFGLSGDVRGACSSRGAQLK
jgi:hypothetical protein